MAKYRPESRGKLEKKVKDLDYEAKCPASSFFSLSVSLNSLLSHG